MPPADDSPPASQLPEETVILDTPVLGPTAEATTEESQIPPAALPPAQASWIDRSKFTSPAPDTVSITPPPSSQVHLLPKLPAVRPQSPPPPHLTSPPPTSQPPQSAQAPSAQLLRDEDINAASVEELRGLVQDLKLELKEARTTSAHVKLQYNMLIVDSAEGQNRMMVELDMAQREIEVLQQAEERRRQQLMSPSSAAAEATTAKMVAMNDLARQRHVLAHEHEQMREVLNQSKKLLEYKDGVIASQEEEIERLRRRIRANREHMNGLLDNMYEASGASPRSQMGTPLRTPGGHGLLSTPRHTAPHRAILSASQPQGNQSFEALLLADKVLSGNQDPASLTAPSTPKTTPGRRHGHVRGVQSLSSLPTTPSRSRQMGPRALQTPPHFSTFMEPVSARQPLSQPQVLNIPPPAFSLATGPGVRRRASSDSTITASSVDGGETQPRDRRAGDDDGEDKIPESQASQAATSMLRRTPVKKGGSMHSSFGSQRSSQQAGYHQSKGSYGSAGGLAQSKLTGKVVKHHASTSAKFDAEKEKRRLASYGGEHGSPSKKSRTDGVGLGIVPAGAAK